MCWGQYYEGNERQGGWGGGEAENNRESELLLIRGGLSDDEAFKMRFEHEPGEEQARSPYDGKRLDVFVEPGGQSGEMLREAEAGSVVRKAPCSRQL